MISHSHRHLQNHRQIAVGHGAVHSISLVSRKGPSTLLAGVPLSPKEAKGESRVLRFRGKTSRKLFTLWASHLFYHLNRATGEKDKVAVSYNKPCKKQGPLISSSKESCTAPSKFFLKKETGEQSKEVPK